MTLDEVRKLKVEYLTAKTVGSVLGTTSHNILKQAHDNPEKLGFPYIIIGKRIKFPRLAFIAFMEGKS